VIMASNGNIQNVALTSYSYDDLKRLGKGNVIRREESRLRSTASGNIFGSRGIKPILFIF
jgi:hypothetical protein